MDKRTLKPEFEAMAAELIQSKEPLRNIRQSNVKIAFLESEHELKKAGKLVLGQCEKIAEKYKWAIPYDFTVTLFAPNIERLTDGQIRIVLYHELLHVGVEFDGNEEIYSIVPHDIEDFREIIGTYGLDWSETK